MFAMNEVDISAHAVLASDDFFSKFGAVVLAGSEAGQNLELLWPVLLIGLGGFVIVAALRGRGTDSSDTGPA